MNVIKLKVQHYLILKKRYFLLFLILVKISIKFIALFPNIKYLYTRIND